MSRPLIGITTDYEIGNPDKPAYHLYYTYAQAVDRAGGLAMVIPFLTDLDRAAEYVEHVDGILFIGGDDLDPALYGQSWHPRAIPVNKQRQDFELSLIKAVERAQLPGLYVCMGMQLLNVHRKGTLHQFIPDLAEKMEHRNISTDKDPVPLPRRHPVHVVSNTLLHQTVGTSQLLTNSYHKQCINELGTGLKISAKSADGIIEAVEDTTGPLCLGVQWHPERLTDEKEHLALFELLVERARQA